MFYYLVKSAQSLIRGISLNEDLGVFTIYFNYPKDFHNNTKNYEAYLSLLPLKETLKQCLSWTCNNNPFKKIEADDFLHYWLHKKTIAPPSLLRDKSSHSHLQQCDLPITEAHLQCVLDQFCMGASKRAGHLDNVLSMSKLVSGTYIGNDYNDMVIKAHPGADTTTPYFPKEEIEEVLESYKNYPKKILSSYIYFLGYSIYSLGCSAAHGATITILRDILKRCKFSKTSQTYITRVANATISYYRSKNFAVFLIAECLHLMLDVNFLLFTSIFKCIKRYPSSDMLIDKIDKITLLISSDKIKLLFNIGLIAVFNCINQPEAELGVLPQLLVGIVGIMWTLGISLVGGYMGHYVTKSLITRVGLWKNPKANTGDTQPKQSENEENVLGVKNE